MIKHKVVDLINMPLDEIMSAANDVLRMNRRGRIELCAIVNAKSGVCSEDCRFCAQSLRHKTAVTTYPLMAEDEILSLARKGASAGAGRVGIVTSGKSPDKREVESIAAAIRRFPEEGVLPCASLGEIDSEALDVLKTAGLKRYHHNIETSENFYPKVVTTHTYRDRIRTIVSVKNAGMEICSGGIFGLGETWEDRIEMARALKELEVDSVPINFLVPIEGTPMGTRPPIGAPDALRIVSIFRLILEKPAIKVVAGREPVLKDLQKMIFSAGADGMMVGGYLTVAGQGEEADKCLMKEAAEQWKK